MGGTGPALDRERRQRAAFRAAMQEMAADPAIQAELRAIADEQKKGRPPAQPGSPLALSRER
jgi:hypothetical protein